MIAIMLERNGKLRCPRLAARLGDDAEDAGALLCPLPATEQGGGRGASPGLRRRTGPRRLEQFVRIARRIIPGALVTATTIGVAHGVGSGLHATPGSSPAGILGHRDHGESRPDGSHGEADGPGQRTAGQLSTGEIRRLGARVSALVAGRMQGRDPAVSAGVAQAVLTESARAGVDPLLVLALIHVESCFDPNAQSERGAVGLMQLREPTMRDVLERSGLSAADARDPVANVQAGVRYLGGLLNSFPGLDYALMAYNAGPTRIRGHLRDGMIPYRYRVYPQKVKKELADLKTTFGSDAPRTLVGSQPQANPRS